MFFKRKEYVLITGGHGFIGHHVARRFINEGYRVIIMDNHTVYKEMYFKGSKAVDAYKALINLRINQLNLSGKHTFIDTDVNTHWGEVLKANRINPKHVVGLVHLANIPRQSEAVLVKDQAACTLTAIAGMATLPNLRKAIYISSSMVYGDFDEPIKEDHTPEPNGIYGYGRLAGEHLFKRLVKQHPNAKRLTGSIVRPSAVYGSLDSDNRVVGRFIAQALKGEPLTIRGKDEVLDFTHVSDVVSGIFALYTKRTNAVTATFNLSKGTAGHTLDTLAKHILSLTKSKSQLIYTEYDRQMPSRNILNNYAIFIETGHVSYYELEDGLKDAIKSVRQTSNL